MSESASFSLISVKASETDRSIVQLDDNVNFILRPNGNFVASKDGKIVAATGCNNSASKLYLVFNSEGDLVVHNEYVTVWDTGCGGTSAAKDAKLELQNRSPYIRIIAKDWTVLYTANEDFGEK